MNILKMTFFVVKVKVATKKLWAEYWRPFREMPISLNYCFKNFVTVSSFRGVICQLIFKSIEKQINYRHKYGPQFWFFKRHRTSFTRGAIEKGVGSFRLSFCKDSHSSVIPRSLETPCMFLLKVRPLKSYNKFRFRIVFYVFRLLYSFVRSEFSNIILLVLIKREIESFQLPQILKSTGIASKHRTTWSDTSKNRTENAHTAWFPCNAPFRQTGD